jgi:hypothetical protein
MRGKDAGGASAFKNGDLDAAREAAPPTATTSLRAKGSGPLGKLPRRSVRIYTLTGEVLLVFNEARFR